MARHVKSPQSKCLPESLISPHCTLPTILAPDPFVDEKPRLSVEVTRQVSQLVESEAK